MWGNAGDQSRLMVSKGTLPCRKAVKDIPRYKAPIPSSFTTVYNACAALRYLGMSRGSAMLWCWAWRRIFMTSIGVTTATASVTPAARPAGAGDMLASHSLTCSY